MSVDYGKRLATALAAIRQLHSDTSKLMVDFDSKMFADGWYSVYENYATRDLTYNVKADCWMASGVYRYYAKDASPGVVEGLTICFFDHRIEEPLLLVSKIFYNTSAGKPLKEICRAWDIWELFFDRTDKRELGSVYTYRNIDNGRIEWAKVLAVPLLSIKSLIDAEARLKQIPEP